ncbi:fructose-specific PTS transporter subunit EIIC [Mycoplasma putrefaciens]|uniref:PTS fructose transporter subunit IIABC n=1 Tax=Mycoplasma putrefaciens TaxID=2123 RepID=UPI003DA683A7
MQVKNLFNKNTSFFNKDFKTKDEVIDFLSSVLFEQNFISNKNDFIKAIYTREKQGSTGVGDGIAIPHALNSNVKKSVIAYISLKQPIHWDSFDNKPVDLIFMIATDGNDTNEHLDSLASISSYLMNPEFTNTLKQSKKFSDFTKVFANFKNENKESKAQNNNFKNNYDVVAITACPTGIAHTYLAQEKILEYAHSLGMNVKIETQGRRGIENALTEEDIKNAKVIILAHDKAIEGMSRFNGYKVLDTSTKDAIHNGKELISNFETNSKTKLVKNVKKESSAVGELSLKKFKDFKGNLLGGVSRMLPFVVAGGIILGLGFLIDFIAGNATIENSSNFGTVNRVAGWFSAAGKTAMMMMVPILGGYIAYSIVGAQGLMPGIVAGLLADGTGSFAYGASGSWSGLWTRLLPKGFIQTNSGFIGAMVGGYIAAFIVFSLTKLMTNFKKSFQGIRDIVFIPILSLLLISVTMFIINIPLGYVTHGIKLGLTWMAKNNLLVILGAVIGLMMCIDMGGPINKIAYVLGVASVNQELGSQPIMTNIMASSMAGGMVPPLGIALCTILFKNVWSSKERDAAKTNWLMGSFFISEGAIPFMIVDPKRISVSSLSGGFITGLLVGLFKITLPAPHGGIFVFPLLNSELFKNPNTAKALGITLFIVAIIIGTLSMSLILGFWKKFNIRKGKLQIVEIK